MTKAEMAKLAKQARRYGYFDNGDGTYSVDCPQKCDDRKVVTGRNHGYRPVGKGKPYSEVIDGKPCIYRQETIAEALDRAVIDHLQWCGTDQSI